MKMIRNKILSILISIGKKLKIGINYMLKWILISIRAILKFIWTSLMNVLIFLRIKYFQKFFQLNYSEEK